MSRLSGLDKQELTRLYREFSSKRCGNCSNWMNHRSCPREGNHIVSYNETACESFVISAISQRDLDAITVEIAFKELKS